MATINVTDSNFEQEVLQSETPVMVDFWAVWCGPCRVIGPIVDEISAEYAGRAKVGKCNVDENQDIPMRYNVRSIPTLLFFVDGEVRDHVIGAVSKRELVQRLDALVGQEV